MPALPRGRSNSDPFAFPFTTGCIGEAPRAGLEPATCGLEDRCSIQLSYRGIGESIMITSTT